jgi:hypothetical protein
LALDLNAATAILRIQVDMASLDAALNAAASRIRSVLPTMHTVRVNVDTSAVDAASARVRAMGGGHNAGWNLPYAPPSSSFPGYRPQTQRPFNFGFTGSNYSGTGGFLTGSITGAGFPYFLGGPMVGLGHMAGTAMTAGVNQGMGWDYQLAQVERILGQRAPNAALRSGLMGISDRLPVDRSDVITMAQAGARGGIGDPGQLRAFTEGLAKLSMVMTDISPNEMAEGMTRILDLFGRAPDKIEAVGSAMLKLDEMSTASAQDIFSLTLRMAGTARQMGMPLENTLALAAGMGHVGIRPERGGTAIQRIMSDVISRRDEMAALVGIDPGDFRRTLDQDPYQGVRQVVQGLSRTSGAVATQEYLKSAGFDNTRDIELLTKWAGILDKMDAMAGAALRELKDPQSLQGGTAYLGSRPAAQMQMRMNQARGFLGNAGLHLAYGGAEAVNQLAGLWDNLGAMSKRDAGDPFDPEDTPRAARRRARENAARIAGIGIGPMSAMMGGLGGLGGEGIGFQRRVSPWDFGPGQREWSGERHLDAVMNMRRAQAIGGSMRQRRRGVSDAMGDLAMFNEGGGPSAMGLEQRFMSDAATAAGGGTLAELKRHTELLERLVAAQQNAGAGIGIGVGTGMVLTP